MQPCRDCLRLVLALIRLVGDQGRGLWTRPKV